MSEKRRGEAGCFADFYDDHAGETEKIRNEQALYGEKTEYMRILPDGRGEINRKYGFFMPEIIKTELLHAGELTFPFPMTEKNILLLLSFFFNPSFQYSFSSVLKKK